METKIEIRWIECSKCGEYYLSDSVPVCFHSAACGTSCMCDFVDICEDCMPQGGNPK